jgi:hypothetical protein
MTTLAAVIAAWEATTGKHSWRNPTAGCPRSARSGVGRPAQQSSDPAGRRPAETGGRGATTGPVTARPIPHPLH